jgi:Uma2 family endonuclease
VLSPSTGNVDKDWKRRRYEAAGVREYWIVSPDDYMVETFVLENGAFKQQYYGWSSFYPDTEVPVTVLPGCVIKLSELFGG